MTLDDRSLREHLDRRAEEGVSDLEQIAEAVMTRVTSIERNPWWRRLGARGPSLGAAAAAIVVLVVALAVVPPRIWTGPGTSTMPPGTTAALDYPANRALSVDELDAFLGPNPVDRAGIVLVADVELHVQSELSCLAGADCPRYRIEFGSREIYVYASPEGGPLIPGPQAFRVRDEPVGRLELVGPVRVGPDGLAWTLPQLTAELPILRGPGARPVPYLYLADAWRAVSTSAYRCLVTVVAGDPDFGCGTGVAWLVPDEASLPSDFNSAPTGSLRVPNVTSVRTRSDALQQHGYWLVDPCVAQDEATCFLCPPSGGVDLIARVLTLDELAFTP